MDRLIRKLHSNSFGRRFMALFLAMLMLTTTMPLNVFAEGEQERPEYVQAEELAKSKKLICGYPEEPAQERELLCEIAEHEHTDDCYALNCDEEHEHTEDCRTLTCALEEHAHSDECYAPMHVHTEDCYAVADDVQAQDGEQDVEDAVVQYAEIGYTKDMGDLLESITVEGLTLDSDGTYHVNANQAYSVKLHFKETSSLGFDMATDTESVHYDLPKGITVKDNSGKIQINVNSVPTYHEYTVNNGTLTVYWNKDDKLFEDLRLASNVYIDFSLSVKFDGSKSDVNFGDSSRTTINLSDTGSVTITKDVTGLKFTMNDSDKESMTFKLHYGDENGPIVEEFTYKDMENGSITFEGLKAGKYTVVEKGHPEFDKYTFDITSVTKEDGSLKVPGTLTLGLTNKYNYDKGQLKLKKTVDWTDWNDGNVMPDDMKEKISFTIKDSSGNVIQTVYYSAFDEKGELTLDLDVGEYTVTETNEITGYTWTYTVNGNEASFPSAEFGITKDVTTEVSFDNKYVQETGSLKVVKTKNFTDGTTNDVPDKTTFKVTYPEGVTIDGKSAIEFTYSQMTTAEGNKEYVLNNLPLGTYKVEEIDSTGNVTGYALTIDGERDYTLTKEGVTATINNTYTPVGSLTIKKDITGLAVAEMTPAQKQAIKFEVTGPDSKVTPYTYSDFTDGKLVVNNLPMGTYTIKEVGSDIDGYTVVTTPDSKEHTVTLTNAGDSGDASFTNTYTKDEYKLKIVKNLDSDGSYATIDALPVDILTGTKFTISGEGVKSKTYTLKQLKEMNPPYVVELDGPGPYTITETNPTVSGIKITTTVSTDGTTYATGSVISNVELANRADNPTTVYFKNKYESYGTIKVDKTVHGLYASEETALKNALRFEIQKKDSNGVFSVVSGLDNLTLDALKGGVHVPPGTYRIVEKNSDVAGYTVTVSNTVDNNPGDTVTTVDFDVVTGAEKIAYFTNTYGKDTTGGGTVGVIKKVSGLSGIEISDGTLSSDTDIYKGISFQLQESVNGQWYNYRATNYTLAELATGIPLRAGKYRIKETGADVTGYSLNVTYKIGNEALQITDDWAVFDVDGDPATLSIVVTNEYTAKGNLVITKSFNSDDDKLPGALTQAQKEAITFTVTGPEYDTPLTFTYADMTNGTKTLSGIKGGTYTVTETNKDIGGGYTYKSTTITVDGNDSNDGQATVTAGETTTVAFANSYERQKGSLKIVKSFEGVAPDNLTYAEKAAMEFDIKNGDTIIETVNFEDHFKEADSVWSYTKADLPTGVYTVVERIGNVVTNTYNVVTTYADDSDTTNDGSVTVRDVATAVVTITNKFTRTGTLVLEKKFDGVALTDEQKADLGLTFNVTGTKDGETDPFYNKDFTYPANFVDGKCTISQLLPGNYTVTETSTATGYTCTTTVKVDGTETDTGTVSLAGGDNKTVTFTNTYESDTQLKVVKIVQGLTGMSKEQEQAIHFSVVRKATPPESDVTVAEFTYADMTNGEKVIYALKPGEYTVTETVDGNGLLGEYERTTTYVVGSGDEQPGNAATINATANSDCTVTFTNTYEYNDKLSVEKNVVDNDGKTYKLVDIGDEKYPIWKFQLTVRNLNPRTTKDGKTTFEDVFDTEGHANWFRLATNEEAALYDTGASAFAITSDVEEKAAPQAKFNVADNTIEISGITAETADKCIITYYLIVTNETALKAINTPASEGATGVKYDFVNRVTYVPMADEPDKTETADGEYDYSFTAVSKELTNFEDGMLVNEAGVPVNRAEYEVVLNPDGLAIGDDEYITVTDTMSANQIFLPESIGPKADITDLKQSVNDMGMPVVTFKIPNRKPVTITYATLITGKGGTTLTNDIALSAFGDSVEQEYTQDMQGSGGGNSYYLTLFKTTEDNITPLEGAEFTLYDGSDTDRKNPLKAETTNEEGKLTIKSWGTDPEHPESFKAEHDYYLIETKTPNGYKKPDKEIWFRFSETPGDDTSGNGHNVKVLIRGQALTVINTPTDPVKVTKQWRDGENHDGIRPDSIIVKLLANGEETDKTLTLSADNKWSGEFTGLDECDEDGKKIVYTVEEVEVPGYTTTITGDADRGFTITNRHDIPKPDTTSVFGSKTWDDNDNQDGKRPDEITINLLKNGTVIQSKTVTAANNWSWIFSGLPKYEDGKLITYTITEDAVENYSATVNGYDVTNSYTPDTTSVSGSKTWDDNDNQDGKRPDKITINLLKNGTVIESKTVTAGDNWSWSFDNLPKYENGKLITYTITEDAVENYSATVNGYDVTNSYTPGKCSISVTKSWRDDNDKDGIRPDKVVVKLFADGKDTGKTLILNSGNNWSGTFTDLDEYNAGVKIIYTIKENRVPGYTAVITGNADNGFVITNSHTPDKPDDSEDDDIPKTGDMSDVRRLLCLLILSCAGILMSSITLIKNGKREQ